MAPPPPRVLVAGVGNVFLGDDGFGVEVARRLGERPLPEGVRAADYGLRSLHLAYELLDHPDIVTVLVDALPLGGDPGTVYLMEPDDAIAPATPGDAHSIAPDTVLALVQALGGSRPRLIVVGCEPADCSERMGLSEPVAGAVDRAVDLILGFVARLDGEARTCA